ncbi:MAG: hypothetical protein ACREOO_25800 [bacterium]
MRVRSLLMLLLVAATAAAQDTHYWNIQYGTRATLLGGAVIGSVSDLSATYYNPGAVALFDNPGFILSAKVYEHNTFTATNGSGPGRDLSSASISPSPSFVAAGLKFRFLGADQLAVSILTRQRMNVEITTRRVDQLDAIPSSPGLEDFAGGLSFDQDFEEIWVGFTWARKLSQKAGLGISPYVAYRNQKLAREVLMQALKTDGGVASLTDIRSFRYQNYRLLAKAGLGFNLKPLTLGLTVTTPSVNVLGKGSTGSHYFLNGVDQNADGIPDNEFVSNYQEEVNSHYNSSWAVGAGGAYDFGKIILHTSAEWFNAVKKFDVLETEDFNAQGSGETMSNPLTNELSSVVNFGIGFDYRTGENSMISGSFVTDFTARTPGTETNLNISRWDIYHITGGTSFGVKNVEITLGLAYSFGGETVQELFEFTTPEEAALLGSLADTKLSIRRLKLLFGFNF